MDLRAKITDVLSAHEYAGKPGGPNCGGICDCPDLCTCGAKMRSWKQHMTDAVMEVIEADLERQRAVLPPAVSIDTYEQSHDEIAAALELAADDRAPVSVTTCSNNVTTYLPVEVAEQARALKGEQ